MENRRLIYGRVYDRFHAYPLLWRIAFVRCGKRSNRVRLGTASTWFGTTDFYRFERQNRYLTACIWWQHWPYYFWESVYSSCRICIGSKRNCKRAFCKEYGTAYRWSRNCCYGITCFGKKWNTAVWNCRKFQCKRRTSSKTSLLGFAPSWCSGKNYWSS